MEAGPPDLKETYEQNKAQLESVKDIMLRNKESLKKKEEELQVSFFPLFLFIISHLFGEYQLSGSLLLKNAMELCEFHAVVK